MLLLLQSSEMEIVSSAVEEERDLLELMRMETPGSFLITTTTVARKEGEEMPKTQIRSSLILVVETIATLAGERKGNRGTEQTLNSF